MKISLSQLNYTVGSFETNTQKIIDEIQKAKRDQVDLLVFSAFSLGGFPVFDQCKTAKFKARTAQAIETIKAVCTDISCLVSGIHEKDETTYLAAYLLESGCVKSIITKKELTTLDWYDERRYFYAGDGCQVIHIQNKTLWVALGEDIHSIPIESKAEGIVHLQNTAFAIGSYEERISALQTVVREHKLPVFQINQVGGQGEILFDGRSLIMSSEGDLIDEFAAFKEETKHVDLNDLHPAFRAKNSPSAGLTDISLIHDALIMGIRDFFVKQGFKKATLGLSGGLDSALVAALTCEALGAENVLAVLMPSIYSSDHSLKDALDLVENTGCHHEIIPIKDAVSSFDKTLSTLFEGRKADLTEENIQARTRGVILMAISNKLGHIVLNTSNKSECAAGYGTLYGDMVGSLSVIADVYKTQAFELARYINRDREVIPENTITKPPSAELRPDQKDSDSLPDYPLMDAILFQYIEEEKSVESIVAQGFQKEVVNRVTGLVDRSDFKRFQTAPILRVSKKAFGRARQMPVVFKN